MIWRTALHYVQFWILLALASSKLTDVEKAQIVDFHNNYRSSVNPQAANMQRMVWDNAVSQVAENYAARCIWGHNPKVFGILGENLFMTLGPLTLSLPMMLWFEESEHYNFNTKSCAEGKICGHYTQMVWANTTFVGCAAQFCPVVPNFQTPNVENATILVCNYYPPGNIMGQSPYKEGAACSSCPAGTIGCVSSTCDRGTSITSGLTSALITSINDLGNLTHSTSQGSSAGFTQPSALTLLLAGLAAFYIRLT